MEYFYFDVRVNDWDMKIVVIDFIGMYTYA